ncbi:glucosidase 2 subunit beta [Lepisosteus oculatus]|uniref:Glucosidase 2 subunit beta n=1 Tax=Lepisosteus oculatus TaxID=7918 RepID=W5MLN5_LEPOC|nr:PREDICTED: glucosidase 2 subunit beta isoform X2 [Lepisosteus oculatus]XP_015204691.1 PREDICTED: glucosidase 2 subunit beta isoform X2 [Lepisosteus oculatus]
MACSQLVFFLTLSCLLVAAVEIQKPRGVPLTNRHFYEESKPFTCLDGTKTISFDRVNDDYCDCKDGSDEPGTSACPNGNFFCANTGYKAQFIPSSRVNDGICDCCDTTDEYNSGAVCENTCKELGRKERESLEKIREITREGFLLKQQLIEEAKKSREEKQRTLGELQESKKGKEEQVEALRTVKETAEQPEKEARERHLKAWEEQKEGLRVEKEKAKMAEVFLELDDDADGLVSVSELQTHVELDPDSDGTLSDTEAQELLGGSTQVDTAAFQNTVWNNIKDKYKSESQHEGLAPPPEESRDPSLDNESDSHYPDEDGGEEEEDDDDEEDDEDHEDDDKAPPVGRPSEKAEEEEPAMPPYDEETQALIDAAQKARDDFNEAEKGLREVEDQIKSLEKEISFDFGPSAEFSYLYNQCYELTTGEYIYRLCPFNRVSQKSKYGGSETNLGSWGLWAGPEDKKYSVMKYEHGTGCWQGPNRSTVVKLTCGKETTVVSTTEPSRCEYLMEFTTPAICQEPQHPDLFPHDEF